MWPLIRRQMWEAGLSGRVSPPPPYSYTPGTANLSDNSCGDEIEMEMPGGGRSWVCGEIRDERQAGDDAEERIC